MQYAKHPSFTPDAQPPLQALCLHSTYIHIFNVVLLSSSRIISACVGVLAPFNHPLYWDVMRLPPSLQDGLAAASAASQTHSIVDLLGSKSGDPRWSSIIGIVTAIIGNILISFALNTQRYAHIRLEREKDTHNGPRNNGKERHHQEHRSQDRRQRDIAKERAKLNRQIDQCPSDDAYSHESVEHEETDPLIPRLKHRGSSESGSTIDTGEKSPERAKRKNYLKSPYWWIGIVLMVIGEAGNFLAYGFAPASIVSPLGVVALISNCLIAPIMLHERFRKRDALGVVIAVGGAVTVVLSAGGNNPKLGPDEIWDLIKRWEFLTYLAITSAVIVLLMIASNRYGDRTLIIDIGLVGLFGGYTALSTKGIASLLSYTLWRALTFPITYLLVAILVATAILQIKYVNRALQRFDSTQVIPTQFVMFTIFVITGSAVLYRDFESTTAAKVGQFIGGCALTFLGVWCLTSGRNGGDRQRYSDEDSNEDNQIDLVDDEADGEHRELNHEDEVTGEEEIKDNQHASVHDNARTDPQNIARSTTPTHSVFNTARNSLETHEPHHSTVVPHSPASFATASSRVPEFAPLSASDVTAPPQPPRFTTTISSPSVPMAATRRPSLAPASPSQNLQLLGPSSSYPARPRTPTQRASTSSLRPTPVSSQSSRDPRTSVPTSPSLPQRERLISRRSLAAGMVPSPLTTPLGGGLSAIVGDLRRRQELQAQLQQGGLYNSDAATMARAATLPRRISGRGGMGRRASNSDGRRRSRGKSFEESDAPRFERRPDRGS